MRNRQRKVAIVGGARIPFTKSFARYARIPNSALMVGALRALVRKYELEGRKIDEVALGTLIHYPTEWNWAREAVLDTGLDPHTPVQFVGRACGTSLDAANTIAMKISTGQIEVGIAGGSDTNSDVPLTLQRSLAWDLADIRNARTPTARIAAIARTRWFSLPRLLYPSVAEPRTGLSMGEHTERTVKSWGIGRAEQDALSLQSHRNATRAYDEGFYRDLVYEFGGLTRDSIVRRDTSDQALALLPPAFDHSGHGTLTAGNSSALTDGAAAVLLCSEDYAKTNDWPIGAFLIDVQNAAFDHVNGEDLLLAPTVAVSRLLARNNLRLQDFTFYEIHEAFAGQVLATLKAWESEDFARNTLGRESALGRIDRTRLNVCGGSVAIGHPFAATGARVLTTAAKLLQQHGGGRCLVSVCTAGGMGTAAIIEA